MEKQRVKKPNKPKVKKSESQVEIDRFDNDDFDFGGFPKDRDLKKNLGCGG